MKYALFHTTHDPLLAHKKYPVSSQINPIKYSIS